MHLNLGQPYEDYIQEQIASGLFGSATEVIRAALRDMKDREERKRLDTIRAFLAVGEEQLAHGEGVPYTSDFMDNALRQAIENSKTGKPVRDEVKPTRS
jgi:antitoxin ParD1/3/4